MRAQAVFVLLLAIASARAATPVLEPGAAADRAVVQRVLAESRVDRVPVPPEASYLGELYRAAQGAVFAAIARGSRLLRLPRWVLQTAAIVLAAGAVLLFLLRLIRPRLRRGGTRETGAVAAGDPRPAAWDADAWRAELERCLAAGQLPEALKALWWWLARSVAGSQAEPDWTSRDLVAHSRRQDLRDLVRSLDLFTYGPRQPEIAELRGLKDRFEEVLS
jgi:hypothetical protein